MRAFIKIFTISFVLLAVSSSVYSQNYLRKRMAVEIKDKSTEYVLMSLERLGGFSFAYNARLIDSEKIISISGKNISVKSILDNIFDKQFDYKVVGSHIIIVPKDNFDYRSNSIYYLSGRVMSREGQPLENAILYEVSSKSSAISNPEGRYSLRLKGAKTFSINVARTNYNDTVLYVSPESDIIRDIYLSHIAIDKIQPVSDILVHRPALQALSVKKDFADKELSEMEFVNFIVPKESVYISDNLNLYENRIAQVSLLPKLGTNYLTSGTVTNNFSLNLIAGYSGDIKGMEIGTVSNIVRHNVNGVQFSGAVNIVGNDLKGLQVAGAVNTNLGNMYGMQMAGGVNRVKGQVWGWQIAGGMNIAAARKDSLTVSPMSVQIAGGANFYSGKMVNFQTAAGINHADNCTGAQIAGGVNICNDEVRGVQIASIYNSANEIKGVQISGLYNRTRKLNGLQLGLINYCDTIESGLPFGLINIVKTGYSKIEISANESFYANIAYKTGGNRAYSFLHAGMGRFAHIGYGLGITTNPRRRLSFNLDYSGSAVFDFDTKGQNFSGNLSRLDLGINLRVYKDISLCLGPSFCYFQKDSKADYRKANKDKNQLYYGNYHIIKALLSDKDTSWLGWKCGIRF